MRQRSTASFAIFGAALALALPARADVVMPPPPHPEDISMALQQEVNRRLGRDASTRMFRSLSAIAVSGGYGASPRDAGLNLLIRDQSGWTSWRTGRPRPVAPAVGGALDRLLKDPALWREDGFVYGQPCPGRGRTMLALHRGQDELTRQLCGPKGLLGQLADLAATERVPASLARPAGVESGLDAARDAEEIILHLTRMAALAWNQGDLDAHLSPYAEDVTVVRPSGIERGKDALRRRVRAAQPWAGVAQRQLATQVQTVKAAAPGRMIHTAQYQFHGGPRAASEYIEYWATSTWQKRGGKWEIVREEVGPERVMKWQ